MISVSAKPVLSQFTNANDTMNQSHRDIITKIQRY